MPSEFEKEEEEALAAGKPVVLMKQGFAFTKKWMAVGFFGFVDDKAVYGGEEM